MPWPEGDGGQFGTICRSGIYYVHHRMLTKFGVFPLNQPLLDVFRGMQLVESFWYLARNLRDGATTPHW